VSVIAPEEARLVFSKWNSEGVGVYCLGEFSTWSVVLQGRVTSVTGMKVRIDSFDRRGALTLDLLETDGIEYCDFEHAPESIRSKVDPQSRDLAAIMVGIPLRVYIPGLVRDKLFFAELPPE